MAEISKAIREIKNTLRQIVLFNTLLASAIFFLTVFFIANLFGLYPEYAWILALIYFLVKILKRIRTLKVAEVEAKYPNLNERLRTAEDTMGQDNFMIQRLRTEVIDKLKNVRVSSFMNLKDIFGKIVAIFILAFLVIVVTTYDVKIFNISDAAKNFDYKPIVRADLFKTAEKPITTQNLTSGDSEYQLYGKASIAKLGDKNIDLVLSLRTDQLDIRNVKKVEEKQFDENAVYEIEARSDASFQENIPKEQQALVKDYFNAINKR
jgi:type IV secretory pathway TrbD component